MHKFLIVLAVQVNTLRHLGNVFYNRGKTKFQINDSQYFETQTSLQEIKHTDD